MPLCTLSIVSSHTTHNILSLPSLQLIFLGNYAITITNTFVQSTPQNYNRIACSSDGTYVTFVCDTAIYVSSNNGVNFTKTTVSDNMYCINMDYSGKYQLSGSSDNGKPRLPNVAAELFLFRDAHPFA